MIKDEKENPRHLPRVSMRDSWFSLQVIRVRLELTTNGLKGHCYDTPTTGIIDHIDIALEVFPSNVSKKTN